MHDIGAEVVLIFDPTGVSPGFPIDRKLHGQHGPKQVAVLHAQKAKVTFGYDVFVPVTRSQ